MDAANILAIHQLLGDFTWLADRGDGDRLAGLFLADGVLTVGGVELMGRAAIAADCYRRAAPAGRKTRHLWCNLRFEKFHDTEIASTIVQLTFEQRNDREPAQLRVNDVFDVFRKDENGSWRIARRHIQPEMALAISASEGR